MISTHVLDTSKGQPAKGIPVRLRRLNNRKWVEVGRGTTNADGRLQFDCEITAGPYQLLFHVKDHLGPNPFYFRIPVIFRVTEPARKYHVPLLLNPFGYSTYRGS